MTAEVRSMRQRFEVCLNLGDLAAGRPTSDKRLPRVVRDLAVGCRDLVMEDDIDDSKHFRVLGSPVNEGRVLLWKPETKALLAQIVD